MKDPKELLNNLKEIGAFLLEHRGWKEEPEKYYYKEDGIHKGIICQVRKDGTQIGSPNCCCCTHNIRAGEKSWIKCKKIKEATNKPLIKYKREIIEYCQDDIPDTDREIFMDYAGKIRKGCYVNNRWHFYVGANQKCTVSDKGYFTWQENHLGKEGK